MNNPRIGNGLIIKGSRVDIISQSKKKLSMKKNIIRTMFRLIKDELGLKELTD